MRCGRLAVSAPQCAEGLETSLTWNEASPRGCEVFFPFFLGAEKRNHLAACWVAWNLCQSLSKFWHISPAIFVEPADQRKQRKKRAQNVIFFSDKILARAGWRRGGGNLHLCHGGTSCLGPPWGFFFLVCPRKPPSCVPSLGMLNHVCRGIGSLPVNWHLVNPSKGALPICPPPQRLERFEVEVKISASVWTTSPSLHLYANEASILKLC